MNGHVMVPHLHQQEAIEIVSGKKENLVVTTGTGSGKSLCFEIPIVNHCLKAKDEGKEGIKAIIIYPMNALANSQYEELANKLGGSGLTIGLYTGDTDVSPDTALEKYKDIFGPDAEPNDSQIISREEMKRTPPDILLTNYVQLELLLTRLDDKPLFRDEFKENLRFLVLDELHTYSGKQGADVAFLVRRLKQRTNTIGKLLCIGTSATMVSDKADEGSATAVADFAAKMFGETFKGENVVVETEDETLAFDGDKISTSYSLSQFDLDHFNHEDLETSKPIFEAIMGKPFAGESNLDLGEALKESMLLGFLEKELKGVRDFGDLAKTYHSQIRSNLSIEECKNELVAGLLLGIVGTVVSASGNEVPRFIPKIHAFYNQGLELRKCLDPECHYKSHTGESTCPECEDEDRGIRTLYPLQFCRVCGQEYYGLTWDSNSKETSQWTFMDFNSEGDPGYYSPDIAYSESMLPDNWFTPKKREPSKKHKHKFPTRGYLDTESNSFHQIWEEKSRGVFIPSPFPICLNCSTEYGGGASEYTKLFLLNSVGRATGTDVITTSAINSSPFKEKKLIGFSDNRQDTAFQAGHLNHWYSQIYFRRIFNKVLSDHDKPVLVKDLPPLIYPYLVNDSELTRREKRKLRESLETYLETFLFVEIRGTKKFTSVNLEDVGLLEVVYEDLNYSIEDEIDDQYNLLNALEENIRFDLIKGFLETFRREVAVGQPFLMDKSKLRSVYQDIEIYAPDARIFQAIEETQVSIFSNAGKDHFRKSDYTFHALDGSYTLRSWVKKCIGDIDNEEVLKYLSEILDFCLKTRYILEDVLYHKKFYYLDPNSIMIKYIPDGYQLECSQCHSQYNWKAVHFCLKNRCKNELMPASKVQNFFSQQYTQDLDENVVIVAEDHSAQVEGQERKIKENKFKKTPPDIQILFATPTMELGIDIGTLSSVYMRNVPPNPSNYAQRAGRAGRSGQGSIIQTFCGSGPGRGAHDQYFYNHTIEIVAGKISVPRFNLDNESLFLSHINALILQTIYVKFPSAAEGIINFLDEQLPLKDSLIDDISDSISKLKREILQNIDYAFDQEINTAQTFTRQQIEKQIDDFTFNLDYSLALLREDYKESKAEIKFLSKEIDESDQARNWYYQSRRTALEKRNEDIRKGRGDFYMYRFLSQVGFLPNYAFPTRIKSVKFQYKKEERELVRDQIIALNEFSPFNTLYYGGQKYMVERVSKESDITSKSIFVICDQCGHIEEKKPSKVFPTNCKSCSEVYINKREVSSIQFPRMHAVRRMRITAEEEERSKGGYKIVNSYTKSHKAKNEGIVKNEDLIAQLSFERTASLVHLNLGLQSEVKEGNIGYNLDTLNRKWVSSDEKKVEDYLKTKNLESTFISKEITLFTESKNDVLTFEVEKTLGESADEYGLTLLNVLLQSICNVLNLDDSEIRGYYQPIKNKNGRIIIFETSEGGTGTLSSIVNNKELIRKIATKALNILHYDTSGNDLDGACFASCYNCICNFYNQRNHKLFDRKLVKDFLVDLASFDDFQKSQDDSVLYDEYINDPKTTSLEKEILKRLFNSNIPMPNEIHKIIYHNGEPVVEADLFYEQKRLCVFIDGPDHDKQHVMDNDVKKRRRLKMLNYKYTVIHHASIETDFTELLSRIE
jgi:superfamily II DNA/RNA helicase